MVTLCVTGTGGVAASEPVVTIADEVVEEETAVGMWCRATVGMKDEPAAGGKEERTEVVAESNGYWYRPLQACQLRDGSRRIPTQRDPRGHG